MKKRMIPALLLILAAAADFASKRMVSAAYEIGESRPIIENILNMTYHTNTGAAFGILKDHRWVFISFSAVAIVMLGIFFVHMQKKEKPLLASCSLALMLGGGIGNMYDRIYYGYVVDFLEFDFVNFAIFNIADTFVCVGSALFVVAVFIYGEEIFSGTFFGGMFAKQGKNEKSAPEITEKPE